MEECGRGFSFLPIATSAHGDLTQAGRSSTVHTMSSVIAAPVDWIESVGKLRFPSKADHRLQELMDRNNEGLLSSDEREEPRPWRS